MTTSTNLNFIYLAFVMTLFLRAKHWQLFIPVIGLPIAIHTLFMFRMAQTLTLQKVPNPTTILALMQWMPIAIALVSAVLFGWIWSIAIKLQAFVPPHVQLNTRRFKVLFFIPVAYFALFLGSFFLIIEFFNSLFSLPDPNQFDGQLPNFGLFFGLFSLLFPLHLFAIFCIFHSMYFAAKTFKTAELQREVSFNDFAGEFFLIWFFPVGVWILQPKLNQLVLSR